VADEKEDILNLDEYLTKQAQELKTKYRYTLASHEIGLYVLTHQLFLLGFFVPSNPESIDQAARRNVAVRLIQMLGNEPTIMGSVYTLYKNNRDVWEQLEE
jgi:hypothetical protein